MKSPHLRQTLLFFTLVLGSSYALADWSSVMQDQHGASYVDMSTVRKTSSGVAFWTLYDSEVPYLERENEYVHSTRVQIEFDCEKNTARSLSTIKYAGRMATGKVVQAHAIPQDWASIHPNTGRAPLAKLVCKSK